MYDELLSLAKVPGARYHFNKHGLYINAHIHEVIEIYDGSGIRIIFDGGELTVWKKNEILSISRPANLMIECEKCLSINNEYKEHIGYVYKLGDASLSNKNGERA